MTDVLIISQLATVRAGLAALLGEFGDLRVVGEARSLDAAEQAGALPEIDVVLLDAPSSEVVEDAVSLLAGVGPALVVLGPSGAASRVAQSAPRLPWVWGFLARETAPERIIAAVRGVAAGLVVLDQELAD